MLLENENAIVSKYINKELLSGIAVDWIEGKSYFEIGQQCIEKGIRLFKRRKAKVMELQDVIDLHYHCRRLMQYMMEIIIVKIIIKICLILIRI